MKIKQATIAQFGKWNNQTFRWHDGVNVIHAPNEWGKTTIVQFLKLMLYGYERGPVSIRDNDRKRYMPWGEKTMGGELIIEHNQTTYVITRTFGKRKGEDQISVVDGVTGRTVPELCVDAPGQVLLGVGLESFEKTLLISQLGTPFGSSKNDEILNKLVNLAQSGEENASYQKAKQLLEAAEKELTGTRPKGKIPQLKEQMEQLHHKQYQQKQTQAQAAQCKQQLEQVKNRRRALEQAPKEDHTLQHAKQLLAKVQAEKQWFDRQQSEQQSKRKRFWALLAVALLAVAAALFLFQPMLSVLMLAASAGCGILSFRQKKEGQQYTSASLTQLLQQLGVLSLDDCPAALAQLEQQQQRKQQQRLDELMHLSRQTGELQHQLELLGRDFAAPVGRETEQIQAGIERYSTLVDDIRQAKQSLDHAFEQLQQQFALPLNQAASHILSHITNGRYVQVMVDEAYQMMVREGETNRLLDAQYISSGAYDQIYFALRMALAQLLLPNAPLILDDAFAQYDDERLKAALHYLQSTGRQVLLFSCHNREQQLC